MKTFVVLFSFVLSVISTLLIFHEIKTNDGKFNLLRVGIERNSDHEIKFFPDVFPDRNLVLELIQLCFDIFCVKNNVTTPEEAISNPKFQYEDWIKPHFSTTCMIVSFQEDGSSRVPVVIFRGSDDRDDYEVDFNIPFDKSKFSNAPSDVKIHRGFQNALFDQNVVQDIEKKILNILGDNGHNVIVTGHSLGAANAHITAAYLADRNPNLKVRMINFAAPRLGNAAFKAWTETKLLNLSAWRFVYRQDAVPRVVLRIMGYVHAGHLWMLYKNSGKIYYRQVGDGSNYIGAPWNWYYSGAFWQHPHTVYLSFIKKKINSDEFWPNHFERRSTFERISDTLGLKKISMSS